jgi:lipoate-protein ligase A
MVREEEGREKIQLKNARALLVLSFFLFFTSFSCVPFPLSILPHADYVFGDLKFVGNAQAISKGRWVHHTLSSNGTRDPCGGREGKT